MGDALAEDVAEDCSNLRQGDVIESGPDVEAMFEGSLGSLGVVVLSQTCDVVQSSKTRCLVAPVVTADDASVVAAKKGRRPLHLYLAPDNSGETRVADMEHAVSLPKPALVGKRILGRHVAEASSRQAGKLAARVGRAFNRFPFPDEVYPSLKELRARVQSKAGTTSPFGQVIDLVDDLRVGADQWASPGRNLSLWVVVPEEFLARIDDLDPDWTWDPAEVAGARSRDMPTTMDLNRVCELILLNVTGRADVLATLWREFGERLETELLHPFLSDEVLTFLVEVLSDSEMSYRTFHSTESLDLEVLSDSRIED